MVPIKNKLILLIFFVNIIGIILNFVLIFKRPSYSSSFFSKESQAQKNEINYSYNNEDNFELSIIKGNENALKENIKILRKLSREEDQKIYVFVLSLLCIYFTVSLLFTFNNEKSQENKKDQANQINQDNQEIQINPDNQENQINQDNQTKQPNNAGNNNRGGVNLIFCGDGKAGLVFFGVILLMMLIFLIYKIYKHMGKKNSAYCSLIFLLIIYMLISIINFVFVPLDYSYYIGGISSGLFLFNFLVILIPNLISRKRQDNNDLEILDAKNPKLIPVNNDSCIFIKDNLVSTPIIKEEDNYNEAPVENMNGIDVKEKIFDKFGQSFDDKNENNQNERESYPIEIVMSVMLLLLQTMILLLKKKKYIKIIQTYRFKI